MRFSRSSRSSNLLVAGLFIVAPFIEIANAKTPTIEVGLRSSWNGAPYLLELLETAAAEEKYSYFPLLNRIANGDFADSLTDEELYASFLRIAQEEGYLNDAETISSFNLALAVHSAAPTIEAHYHYYTNWLERSMGTLYNRACRVWIQHNHEQICSNDSIEDALKSPEKHPNKIEILPFDHVLKTKQDSPEIVVYADIKAPEFGPLHKKLLEYVNDGRISYRLRYRTTDGEEKPVDLSGYGVELALKKTDYIVMDDRDVQDSQGGQDAKKGEFTENKEGSGDVLEEEELPNVKPLHQKDIRSLGIKSASWVLNAGDPLRNLVRLTGDFLKHTPAISTSELDEDFMKEYLENLESGMFSGENAIWINGLKLDQSQVNAFSLLDSLRRERKYMKALTALGMNASQATGIATHNTIREAKEAEFPQRFDFTDQIEGKGVIIWLNDLEQDERYASWPTSARAIMQRLFPGQLPQIRRNIFNFVVPVDFTNKDDVTLIVDQLQTFVMRKIALRFGLVPIVTTHEAARQAKILYHLLDVYGLNTVIEYLAKAVQIDQLMRPSKKVFDIVIKEAELRPERTAKTFEETLDSQVFDSRVEKTRHWGKRLGAFNKVPTAFFDGLAIPRDENWLTQMSSRLELDVMLVARAVYQSNDPEAIDLQDLLLGGNVARRRNPHIFPDDDVTVNQIDIAELVKEHGEIFLKLPTISAEKTGEYSGVTIWVVGDFDQDEGLSLLRSVATVHQVNTGLTLVAINNPELPPPRPSLSTLLYYLHKINFFKGPENLIQLINEVPPTKSHEYFPKLDILVQQAQSEVKTESWYINELSEANKFWMSAQRMLENSGLKPGQRGLVINGRVIGPIPREEEFTDEDVKQLLDYEMVKRIKHVLKAGEELDILPKLSGQHALAILTNVIALLTVPEVPPGLFESVSSVRVNDFDNWGDKHSCIKSGDKSKAIFNIVASIDPASERAQKWVPILKVLSEMEGVHMRIFLNPQRTLQELPIKRFYRHVLDSKPTFDKTGKRIPSRAQFAHMPEEDLLTLGMDVPPSWLVTPKESIHDLDNIKLSTMKEHLRGNVHAIYELRSILIQGHARDLTTGNAPKGAQLVLGTEQEPHFADTIVMANLGYFQFKANPGYWKIGLKDGSTKDIFKIDSAGINGNLYHSMDDKSTEIALTSFVGVTLFPKLSRKPGMEQADVLDPSSIPKTPMAYVKQGWNAVNKVVASLGLLSDTKAKKQKQADINIFSVASGHLYERFLGIMILSVMKHTNHTVKFWFIENFLSPSFKDFLPVMSKEYHFDYELVTYKWPHWLRAQKEKQREIWGYKILFLDVLFPLDLDKVIFVDADQIVRTDLKELVDLDLEGAPYGFTPMCDSRTEIEGFRFWKQGYWKNFLQGKPYHISALYVVDLKRFRQMAAGDRLRQQYHTLSADPNSLANLDQDLPNHMQSILPIQSLPQDWLWCETWCSDESLATAKTIDLCNNPMTKEPKLDRARRQVKEWVEYDQEISSLARRTGSGGVTVGHLQNAEGEPAPVVSGTGETKVEEESSQNVKDEL